mmetsp:Transcript_33390/g.66212  ORF Transcript_33390/g.66212 Transcript_33390/m.66212 type:complete len:100 (-) Transcript_33390:489-788(-)
MSSSSRALMTGPSGSGSHEKIDRKGGAQHDKQSRNDTEAKGRREERGGGRDILEGMWKGVRERRKATSEGREERACRDSLALSHAVRPTEERRRIFFCE